MTEKKKGALALLGGFLSRLLKPFAKQFLIAAVKVGGDQVQKDLKTRVLRDGPEGVDKLFDKLQARAAGMVRSAWFVPEWMKKKALVIITEEGDRFQKEHRDVYIAAGVDGLNDLFDKTQMTIAERIKAF